MYTYASEATDRISEVSCSGTQNIIEAASHAGVDRVILTSSSVTAGYSDNPHTLDERSVAEELEGEAPYVVSKVRQERLALETADELGVDLLCVCPTMSVGPCGNDLGPSNAIVITYLEDPLRMTYPGGCNIVSVRDVARGHILAAGSGIAGEKYLLGSENLEWPEVHTMISELCGVDGPNIKASHTACFLAAAGEEVRARLEKRQPRTTRKQALMLGRYYWYDHGKAAAIGYQPRPARQALAEAIAWLAASPHMSRELRTRLRLSREVYEARNTLKMAAAELQPDHALV